MKISTCPLAFLISACLLATGCMERRPSPPPPPTSSSGGPSVPDQGTSTPGTEATARPPPSSPSGEPSAQEEACLDRWLKDHNLDPYGNAAGTMYAGGTPLFNEQTGATTKRTDYVYARQPAAQKACTSAR